jgi:putative membrane protein
MHYLSTGWSFDPFVVMVAVLVGWYEIGLARLASRSRPDRTAERRWRSALFYAGLGVLLLAVSSPIDFYADEYFFVHMIQHLLIMFAAPVLIVAAAPWQPLLAGLPGRLGRDATREVMTGAWSRPAGSCSGRGSRLSSSTPSWWCGTSPARSTSHRGTRPCTSG